MAQDSGLRFLIHRGDLRNTRLATDEAGADAAPLAPGQARLRVLRFALTANNITYAAFGEAMKYWQFFPTGDAHWGCMPVWGFAEVSESRAEGVSVGRRVYGFLPAGTHLVVQPERVGARGFVDGAAHRAELAAVYNQLLFCDADPGYDPAREAHQALLRPLFTTSFLIDDFMAGAKFFGAQQVLLSSASSKTAWGTALCMALRKADRPACIVGLTSASNKAYVKELGLYDRVLAYEELDQLDGAQSAVYVDFCGDAGVRRRIHEHWGNALAHSCSVGGTRWEAIGGAAGLPGPRPTLFFAPSQYRKRMAPPPEGYGAAELNDRMARAWMALMQRAGDPASGWLKVQEAQGAVALEAAYRSLLEGRADPREGLMIRW